MEDEDKLCIVGAFLVRSLIIFRMKVECIGTDFNSIRTFSAVSGVFLCTGESIAN